MRTALITALVLLLVPAGSSLAHVRSSAGYSDVRGEGSTVRYELSLETSVLDVAQLWTATARLGGWQDAAPTAAGGRVFIGSNNGVIARDAATGADLWQHQSPDASWIPQNATPSAPAVAGETLYMGFPNGRVTPLDAASGAVVWSVRLPGQPYLGGVLSPPAVSGDTVYVGANDGHLYGLDRATGAERWKFEIGSWVASGPAISGNALLAGAWDGNLYAFTEG